MPIIYDELKPLTILDPLFLYGSMYICPKKELPGLFAKVHPFFSMSLLSKLLKESREVNLMEVINLSRMICTAVYVSIKLMGKLAIATNRSTLLSSCS